MRSDRTMKRALLSSLVLGPALLVAALLIPGAAAAATVSLDLCAKPGSLTLPGPVTVPIWGFGTPTTAGDCTTASPGVPGPGLTVNEGDVVTVNLHNGLSADTSLEFEGVAMVPDLAPVAPGATRAYTFTATAPGTYLYEAGLLPGSQYQVAMGLYGVLVVRPATTGQAYDDPGSAFDEEALLVLGEVDPALNRRADPSCTASCDPATFDLRSFAPKYSLINGVAYSSAAAPINATSGNRLLLRYANAGIQHHSIGVLGLRQSVLAADGSPSAYPRGMVAETLAPGQTADVLVVLPPTAAASTKYAVYDAALTLNNNGGADFGGMLAFINAAPNTTSTGDTVGPITSNVNLDLGTGALAASVTDGATGNSGVGAAEYFIDATGTAGLGSPMAVTVTADPTVFSASVTIPSATLNGLASGSHTVYVHGQDAATPTANWGAFSSFAFSIDKTGPSTTALGLTPSRTNGTVDVAISATGDDAATGGSNVTAAEYTITNQATNTIVPCILPSTYACPLATNKTAPTVSLTGTIAQAAISVLNDGSYTVSVRSQDAAGNWGLPAATSLAIDRIGPVTTNVTANPNPNNGTLGISSSNPSVRVSATFADADSSVVAGEGFIDAAGANGTGFPFVATDGVFNAAGAPGETGYADIPLTTISQLSTGNHTIFVRGKDSAGNWGNPTTTLLTIDRTPPTGVGITRVGGSAATSAASVQFLVTFSESVTGVTAGNFNLVSTGLGGTRSITSVAGAGATWTVTATTGIGNGTLGLNLTSPTSIKDLAGNAMTAAGLPLVGQVFTIDRTAPTFSSITLAPASITAGAASVNLTVNGASDTGGSGVVGGEYWFGATNITAGTGTAFTGLTNVPIATASLAPGTYTVRVRIIDAAGNWSTGTNGVRTATLTVTAPIPDAIFSDGFESGTTGAWSSVSTTTLARLNVTAAAALVGSFGLQAQGNNTNYVQNNFSPASGTYDARFSFTPNGNTSTGKDILAAATTSGFGTQLFHVRYRLNAGQAQVQVQVGATANPAWVNLAAGANAIEVTWQSGSTLQLYVNGTLSQTLTAPTGNVGAVRLGSVTTTGNATLMYFDAFASKRSVSPLFGP